MHARKWLTKTEQKKCGIRARRYYRANAETLRAKRRARYRAKVLGKPVAA